MSEEAKVRLVDKATDNVSSGKKIESREEKGSVKHWKLGSYNCDNVLIYVNYENARALVTRDMYKYW